MARMTCPVCGTNADASGGDQKRWRFNTGQRFCPSCHAHLQYRHHPSTIYLRFPFLIGLQCLVGMACLSPFVINGTLRLGNAKLILAAIIMGPLLVWAAAIRLMPGTLLERIEQ